MKKTDASGGAWMPLYVGDYLADTSRLSTIQHGAYLLLIMDYWRNGPLPNNPETLAQIAKMSLDAWSIHQAMLSEFFSITPTHWVHNRVDTERAKAAQYKQMAHDRASRGAQARWGGKTGQEIMLKASSKHSLKQSLGESSEVCLSNAKSQSQSHSHSQNPNPPPPVCPDGQTPPSTKKTAKNLSNFANALDQIDQEAVRSLPEGLAIDFLALRKGKRLPMTETALKGLIRESAKAGISLEKALTICCERGWGGFKAEWISRDYGAQQNSQMTTAQKKSASTDRSIENWLDGDRHDAEFSGDADVVKVEGGDHA